MNKQWDGKIQYKTKMKTLIKLLCAFSLLVQVLACSQENEIIDSEGMNISETMTRQFQIEEADGKDSIAIMPVNPDSLKCKLIKENFTRYVVQTAVDYDPYFSSNMYVIDGLPFTLKARDGGKYLSAAEKWEEVKWTTAGTSTDQKFYVKVLPASSGIPYLIYSHKTKTPIGVGQYTNKPEEKILLVHKDDTGSLYNASWDFIQSPNYPGYYAIESQSYLGQSDPNNPWSIFYHVLEVKDKNLVRYGQYTKKAQQEFAIKPDAVFTLKNIEYVNPYNAKVTRLNDISIVRSRKNPDNRIITHDFVFDSIFTVPSNYIERKTIDFNVDTSNELYRRPNVTQDKIDFVVDLSKEPDSYYRTSQTIDDYIRSGVYPAKIEPYHKVYGTYYFKQFRVEADYIATITYNGKEAKISGRWSGIVIEDEIFDADFEAIDLRTNRSLGKKRINMKSIDEFSPITF